MKDRHRAPRAAAPRQPGALSRCRRALAALALRVLARLLAASWRIRVVDGRAHIDRLVATPTPAILVCWHQRLAACAYYGLRTRGLRPVFLVSPSRDGDLVARVVTGLGAAVARGSATRSGARALRELFAVIRGGLSPVVFPDGPHGPARRVKPGTVVLARMTRAPLLPMAFAASRYWQLASWDALIVPKPFARVAITIGAPQPIDTDNADDAAQKLALQLDAQTAAADRALRVAPRQPAPKS